MSEKFNEQQIPIAKWCLLFKQNLNIESKFQDSSWKAAYQEMKSCHIVLIIISSLIMMMNISLHMKNINMYSESENLQERAIFWQITRHPIFIFVFTLEIILCKFKFLNNFRGVWSVVVAFSLIADSCTFIFPKLDIFVYGTMAIFGLLYIYWVGQTIIYNWIMFVIAYIVGYCSFCAIIILRDGAVIASFLYIFLIGIFAVYLSRQREITKRREYFILVTVKKRGKELKKADIHATIRNRNP